MERTTIDFGIDLGTTNSSIAVLDGVKAEVIRNNFGLESTPSAVYIDKRGNLIVGSPAYEKVESETENTANEFKLQMGSDHTYTFERNGRAMTPEELSAEVLKALKGDVNQRLGEDLRAAVISVPAVFELPQSEATRRAAEMAGLVLSPLVQEPVAAAMAYGFQDESDKVFWLVYDIGGGTFDAAIIQVRDGIIQVINHGGDNHLGGKNVDWSIVEALLLPAIEEEFSLDGVRRGDPRWRGFFAKLKSEAERAKIQVSRLDSADIVIDHLRLGPSDDYVDFEFALHRSDVEKLIEPIVARSINISRQVLKEKGLAPGDIERIILVGGPTLTPHLRERLADKKEGLGIPLEFSIDPMTIVAQGAAIFAGTQRIEGISLPTVEQGQFELEVEYKPVGPDVDPIIGGRVVPPSPQDLSGFTIEFANNESDPKWRSGKIRLDSDGIFTAELRAERGRRNEFEVELMNAEGSRLDVRPNRIPFTVGQVITDPPLTHSVGVALADNEVLWFFKKGTPLPARQRKVLRTAVEVRKGHDSERIRIPVIEGKSNRANRNTLIGRLEFDPAKITRDVPLGSEVEVTIEIDRSRLLRTEAFVPLIDATDEEPLELEYEKHDAGLLVESLEREKARLAEIRGHSRRHEVAEADEAVEEIEREHLVKEVESSLEAAEGDRDALDRAEHRLRDLQAKIDRAEDSLELPGLMAEAEKEIESTRKAASEFGDEDEKRQVEVLEKELRDAMRTEHPDLLRGKIEQLRELHFRLILKQPAFWVAYLGALEERKYQMNDQALADDLFARGRRAIQQGDLSTLQSIVRQLNALLPQEVRVDPRSFGSTVID